MAEQDWFDGGGGGRSVDVPALLDSEGGVLLHRCVQQGALVSLGLTKDGGALGVTVTVDGRWRREYFRDAEELTEWAIAAAAAVEQAMASSASSAPAPRQRRSRGL